jgi:FKBP-type peptidyl-prolyl cis-trans isomerase FkpA
MKRAGLNIAVVLSLFALACGDNHKHASKTPNLNSKEFQDKLIEANKMYVKKESDEIDAYVAMHSWNMTTTGTGLRYMITSKGSGESAKLDSLYDKYAKVKYKISLLNGSLCYSSDKDGPKEFFVGRDNVEAGLHEGIQYLHEGDKAVIILPSHLAHGLMGDQNKIPPKSSVIYELELLSVRKVARPKK